MVESLNVLLDKAASFLGVAADKVYEIALKQAQVTVVTDFVWIIIAVTLIAGGLLLGHYLMKKSKEVSSWDEGTYIMFGWLSRVIPTIIGLSIIITSILEIIQIKINPELWIIEYLVNLFK